MLHMISHGRQNFPKSEKESNSPPTPTKKKNQASLEEYEKDIFICCHLRLFDFIAVSCQLNLFLSF